MSDFRPAPATLPAGHRIYAIGDVHGCDARLAALHAQVADDLAARPVAVPLLLHIGDLIDRGPDSAGVVARLAAGSPVAGLPVLCLKGNHERTLLEALAGDRAARTDYLAYGGVEALTSWGVEPADAVGVWAAGIPVAHRRFLAALPLTHRVGGYLFVHAGVRPGVALERQAVDDLLCIRTTFLHSEADHGAVVVHGHTPTRSGPEVRRNRIGIDTGAVFGGALTCLILEGDRLAFLQA